MSDVIIISCSNICHSSLSLRFYDLERNRRGLSFEAG